MLFLGIDLGTSSVKVSVYNAETKNNIISVQYPETEAEIITPQPGWAEQDPAIWWQQVQLAILKAHAQNKYNPKDIIAIGIAYQMHGLVCLDAHGNVLRNSIIWCDSRAVEIGNTAFHAIGTNNCLLHLLNSPGNFTASKLAWVKQYEPEVFEKIATIMLPGDYIAYKLTNNATTTISALSEGVFWDFHNHELSKEIFNYFNFSTSIIPPIQPVFISHGKIEKSVAESLSLNSNVTVSYKAGDQPNNALALNVFEPGEFAATAGTSGVIYGVTDRLTYDDESRINTFAHVNHQTNHNRLGVLLCINGTGILNKWIKNITHQLSYNTINDIAAQVPIGADGVKIIPFGNGAERILKNKFVGSHLLNIDFNRHNVAHVYRATQEGIAFAFKYGLQIMQQNGMGANIIRAGLANMFLSNLFTTTLVDTLNIPIELYKADGSIGAAIGAAIGNQFYQNTKEAFDNIAPQITIQPNLSNHQMYNELYAEWLEQLNKIIT
jgi:xylulokinase